MHLIENKKQLKISSTNDKKKISTLRKNIVKNVYNGLIYWYVENRMKLLIYDLLNEGTSKEHTFEHMSKI